MMQSPSKRMRSVLRPVTNVDPVRISGKRARELVEAGARFIDVRTEMEHGAGHVPGSVNIPVAELRTRLSELGPRDGTIVLYCRSGARSMRGAQMLRDLGYPNTYDMGPHTAWPNR